MRKKKTQNLNKILYGDLTSVILLTSFPLICNVFVLKLFDLFNVLFASVLGANELASVLFVAPIINVLIAILSSMSIALTTYISPIYVKNNGNIKNEITSVYSTLFYIYVIFISILALISKEILVILNVPETLINITFIYFILNIFGLYFDFFSYFYLGLSRAKGNMKQTLNYTLFLNCSRLLLGILCIVFLNLDIVGLGLAILIPKMIYGTYSQFKMKKDEGLKVGIKTNKLNTEFFKILIPIGIDKITVSIGFVLINSMIIVYSTEVMTAFNVTNSINSLLFTPTAGLATAMVTILAQNLAVPNVRRSKKLINRAILIILIYCTVASIILVGLSGYLVKPFTAGDKNLEIMTIHAMHTYSWSIFGFALGQLFFSIFYALGTPETSMWLSILKMFGFRIIPMYILLSFTSLGEYAIWISMLVSNFALIPIVIYILKNKYKTLSKS